MEKLETLLPGTLLLRSGRMVDNRGEFVKTFHDDVFRSLGVYFKIKEEFYSVSSRNVVRGMHFQLPPFAHNKSVYCARGRVLDVLLDLRAGPGYGAVASVELSFENKYQIYIPAGVAHGFLSLEENSMLVYRTSSVHEPSREAGILWNSFGFNWPISEPILSSRDSTLPGLGDFSSPF